MVSRGDVAVGWAGGAACEFSACSITVAVAFTVFAEYSVGHAFLSHMPLFTAS